MSDLFIQEGEGLSFTIPDYILEITQGFLPEYEAAVYGMIAEILPENPAEYDLSALEIRWNTENPKEAPRLWVRGIMRYVATREEFQEAESERRANQWQALSKGDLVEDFNRGEVGRVSSCRGNFIVVDFDYEEVLVTQVGYKKEIVFQHLRKFQESQGVPLA